jgi:4-hydroxybenzoate polyprenyltransferase
VVLLYATSGAAAAVAGLALAANIVLYDAWHKNNPLGPAIMGGCRVLVYVTAALAAGALRSAVLTGAAALFAYLIGLTYTAKIEGRVSARLWPLAFLAVPFVKEASVACGAVFAVVYVGFLAVVVHAVRLVVSRRAVGRAIVLLLAGISLLDALLVAGAGHPRVAIAASLGFFATRGLQRWVSGT